MHMWQIRPFNKILYSYLALSSFILSSSSSKLNLIPPLYISVESESVAASRRVSPIEKVYESSRELEGSDLEKLRSLTSSGAELGRIYRYR